MTGTTKTCPVCHASYHPRRSDSEVCSPTCRQRKKRGTYVVTEEDRAVIDRVLADDSDLPPRLTPEQVRAHVYATARRHG